MISPQDALAAIFDNITILPSETLPLNEAKGRILASDVKSIIDMPPFNQSAMDGYVVSDLEKRVFNVVGEQRAGDAFKINLDSHQAMRIFTGALVPESGICVIKQEDVTTVGDKIEVNDTSLKHGLNIRRRGEQIEKGEIAVRKGTKLNAGAIGYLATLGVSNVDVFNLPKISIVVTGSELVKTGARLQPGQIYESNSLMLETALYHENVQPTIYRVDDNEQRTIEVLERAFNHSDIVIATGGISVGKYDFVYEALQQHNVRDVFYKVAQKPGKPLYCGTLGQKLVFGLPGNPAAALTCFYLYIIPALRKMQGYASPQLVGTKLPLREPFHKKGTLHNHLKGKIEGDSVSVLPKQSSAMLGDFTDANCIVILPGEEKRWETGEQVELLILPQ